MAWIDKSEHILLRRKYQCEQGHVFEVRSQPTDPLAAECPTCVAMGAAGESTWMPPRPALATTKSKAIDIAQQMAEEDYGLTDMNDNQRAGDIAFKAPPPMQTAEREKEMRAMMEAGMPAHLPADAQEKVSNYWQGNAGGAAEQTIATQGVAAPAAAAARAQGVEPLGILERGRQAGMMNTPMNVMGAVSSSELPPALQQAQAARGV